MSNKKWRISLCLHHLRVYMVNQEDATEIFFSFLSEEKLRRWDVNELLWLSLSPFILNSFCSETEDWKDFLLCRMWQNISLAEHSLICIPISSRTEQPHFKLLLPPPPLEKDTDLSLHIWMETFCFRQQWVGLNSRFLVTLEAFFSNIN